jgi:excisionase family DNA binding protein
MDGSRVRNMLTRREAAEYLGIRPQTLASWACNGRYGLRFIKIGKCVRYKIADLDAFVERRAVGAAEPSN